MSKKQFAFSYSEISLEGELDAVDRNLMHEARKAMPKAYAPYSGFLVGAAVLLENGKIICGNNQENIAFPSGLCAERVALFAAGAQFPEVPVKTVAITAFSHHFTVNTPVSPCGSCRQVLIEYENRHKSEIRLILQGQKGKIWVVGSCKNLLPLIYLSENLKRKK